jgi:hypothetical protein
MLLTRQQTDKTTFLRAAFALVMGMLTGVALVVMVACIQSVVAEANARAHGHGLMFPISFQIYMAFCLSLYGALIVAGIATPIWWLLRWRGLGTWRSAGALGYLIALLYWVATNFRDPSDFPQVIESGLLWSVAGAAGGLVTWWIGYRAWRPRPIA